MFELVLGANLVVDSTENGGGGGKGGTQDVENDHLYECPDVIFSVKSELFLVS